MPKLTKRQKKAIFRKQVVWLSKSQEEALERNLNRMGNLAYQLDDIEKRRRKVNSEIKDWERHFPITKNELVAKPLLEIKRYHEAVITSNSLLERERKMLNELAEAKQTVYNIFKAKGIETERKNKK